MDWWLSARRLGSWGIGGPWCLRFILAKLQWISGDSYCQSNNSCFAVYVQTLCSNILHLMTALCGYFKTAILQVAYSCHVWYLRTTIFTALILVFIVSLQLVQRWKWRTSRSRQHVQAGSMTSPPTSMCWSGVYYAWPISSESFFFYANKGWPELKI